MIIEEKAKCCVYEEETFLFYVTKCGVLCVCVLCTLKRIPVVCLITITNNSNNKNATNELWRQTPIGIASIPILFVYSAHRIKTIHKLHSTTMLFSCSSLPSLSIIGCCAIFFYSADSCCCCALRLFVLSVPYSPFGWRWSCFMFLSPLHYIRTHYAPQFLEEPIRKKKPLTAYQDAYCILKGRIRPM